MRAKKHIPRAPNRHAGRRSLSKVRDRRTPTTACGAVILVLLAYCPRVLGGSADVAIAQPITTPVEAFNRAYLYTGFKEIKSVTPTAASAQATCTRLERDDTPFLSDSTIGRPVWLVELKNVRIESTNWLPSWIDRYNPKSFTAVIDSATGRLLKIHSDPKVQDPDLAPEPPADTAAALMKAGGEEYLGFPDDPPAVTFAQALAKASGSDPLRAKELIAVYVWYSYACLDNGKPRPAWCITGRGVEPLDLHPTTKPLYMRNRRRTIIDATTGDLIGITTSPPVMVPYPAEGASTESRNVAPMDSVGEKK